MLCQTSGVRLNGFWDLSYHGSILLTFLFAGLLLFNIFVGMFTGNDSELTKASIQKLLSIETSFMFIILGRKCNWPQKLMRENWVHFE